jgi:formylmethanofuran dehydrogenase subunit E
MTNLENVLKEIENFHGHIGPYAVIGYRMGQLAVKVLGEDRTGKRNKAVAYCGNRPPVSCMLDGIQMSSCCTMGKGNITVEDRGEVKALFSNYEGKSMELSLRPEVLEKVKKEMTKDTCVTLSKYILALSEEKLFIVNQTSHK